MARIANRNLGLLTLAIYLILVGAVQLVGLSFEGLSIISGLLAVVAGVLLILGK